MCCGPRGVASHACVLLLLGALRSSRTVSSRGFRGVAIGRPPIRRLAGGVKQRAERGAHMHAYTQAVCFVATAGVMHVRRAEVAVLFLPLFARSCPKTCSCRATAASALCMPLGGVGDTETGQARRLPLPFCADAASCLCRFSNKLLSCDVSLVCVPCYVPSVHAQKTLELRSRATYGPLSAFAAIRGCSFAPLPCVVIDVCWCVARGQQQAAQLLPHAVGCWRFAWLSRSTVGLAHYRRHPLFSTAQACSLCSCSGCNLQAPPSSPSVSEL